MIQWRFCYLPFCRSDHLESLTILSPRPFGFPDQFFSPTIWNPCPSCLPDHFESPTICLPDHFESQTIFSPRPFGIPDRFVSRVDVSRNVLYLGNNDFSVFTSIYIKPRLEIRVSVWQAPLLN